jgi:mono/diheme cytochrome c family protein
VKSCVAVLGIMSVLLVVSLGQAQQQDQPPHLKITDRKTMVYSELDKAPEKARSRRNPLEDDPEASLAGQKLFEQHCSECHGDQAVGGRHAPSLRIPEVQNAPPGAIFWLVTNGVVRHGMPVWSKLPEPQRWQLVTYIKSLSTTQTKVSSQRADNH